MENENLLNQLIGKVKEFEALRNTICLRNVDYVCPNCQGECKVQHKKSTTTYYRCSKCMVRLKKTGVSVYRNQSERFTEDN